jgi:outer membrane PBP1 activator LpoA protein
MIYRSPRVFCIFQIFWILFACTPTNYIEEPISSNAEEVIPEQNFALQPPSRIAIILPFSTAPQISNSLLDGFLSSYFNFKQENTLSILSVDSSSEIEDIFNDLDNFQPDFIIGPFAENRITVLLQQYNSLPFLVLNQASDDYRNMNGNAYFFRNDLSNELSALKPIMNSGQNGILFVPNNAYGDRISSLLEINNYLTESSKLISFEYESDSINQLDMINDALLIEQSNARLQRLNANLARNISFVPRRRNDIDFLMVFGQRRDLTNLIPQIKYSFANDLQIFTLSESNQSTLEIETLDDFDRVIFPDYAYFANNFEFPFKESFSNIQIADIEAVDNINLQRFYAFGKDLFNILSLMQSGYFIENSYEGFSGLIHLENNVFIRDLNLYQINGNALIEYEN